MVWEQNVPTIVMLNQETVCSCAHMNSTALMFYHRKTARQNVPITSPVVKSPSPCSSIMYAISLTMYGHVVCIFLPVTVSRKYQVQFSLTHLHNVDGSTQTHSYKTGLINRLHVGLYSYLFVHQERNVTLLQYTDWLDNNTPNSNQSFIGNQMHTHSAEFMCSMLDTT